MHIRHNRALTWAALFAILLVTSCGDSDQSPAPSSNTLTVGALLSLTGNWASLGQNSQATMEIGVADVNAYLASVGAPLRVALQVEDTQLDPSRALDRLRDLRSRGVTVVVGPQSSAEVAALKPFADANGMIVVSQGSTAHSLAIAGDNIFRLCPDDVQEAVAIAALMLHDDKIVIVPMTRQDPGNQGLQTSVKATIAATVLPEAIYPADEQDFEQALNSVELLVQESIAQSGTSAVAVYLTAFDEAASIFKVAAEIPALGSVRWYGSDGVAGSAALVNDTAAAAFATHVGFPCPIFGLDPAARHKWEPLSAQVRARTGLVPDAFALSTYDAVWLTALAALQNGGVGDVARFKRAFTQTASSYFGVTGSTELNEAGDRKSGTFDFQGICPTGTGYGWQSVGTFVPLDGATGAVTFNGCTEQMR